MNQTPLATAADYAEALLTARRAKALLTLSLLFVLLTQLTLFFLLRYYRPLPVDDGPAVHHTREVIEYFVGLLDIAGLILPLMLSVVLHLILKVQLVGRLLGVGRLTAAFLWSVLLCLLLFPWQAVLNNPVINSDPLANALGMKIPGVLYTWAEISNPIAGARFGMADPASGHDLAVMILHWARYLGFPILSVLILTIIHFKSDRGLRLSLGGEKIATQNLTQQI
jgi:hypothetical protein